MIHIDTAARQWGIPIQKLSLLCAQQKIPGAILAGEAWFLPDTAQKPLFAHPFLKWAGGKSRSLAEIAAHYPAHLGGEITRYAEPFVGGGAVLFHVLSHYHIEQAYLSDTNPELINVYRVVQRHAPQLIQRLEQFSAQYLPLEAAARKLYYYEKRNQFNAGPFCAPSSPPDLERAALFIFLNRTCFNGLYRVNRKGKFNVPIGRYRAPEIVNAPLLRAASAALEHVELVCGSYAQSADFIDANTFVYLDPPYRPLSPTSSFTAYTQDAFDDDSQRALADFFAAMADRGARLLLSNSDPKNSDPNDTFFDELYAPFHIHRLRVGRAISAKGNGRGKVSELLISNYP